MKAILDIFPMSSRRSKECLLKATRADVSTSTTENMVLPGVMMHPARLDLRRLFPQVFLDVISSPKPYKFTGKERDSESGNDYFGARHYSRSFGRFMQLDPSPMGIAMADSQPWNLYSYVRNRPTRSVDVGGNWATDLHAEIVTFALQGYVSAGELQELVNRQYVMDSDQSDQSRHFMQNAGEHDPSKAAEDAWTFVADNMNTASENVGANGQLNKTGLDALGNAIHTVEGFTSPCTPTLILCQWNGGVAIGLPPNGVRELPMFSVGTLPRQIGRGSVMQFGFRWPHIYEVGWRAKAEKGVSLKQTLKRKLQGTSRTTCIVQSILRMPTIITTTATTP